MIITCPSCATRYNMPASHFSADGTMIKCAACGHGWMESRAIEVISEPEPETLAIAAPAQEPDREVERLLEAARLAKEAHAASRKSRQRRLMGWGAFAAVLTLPFVIAALFPEYFVRAAPATVVAYDALGREVNIYGLEIRRIEMTHNMVDGKRILSVQGEIANISKSEQKMPWLRFGLRNAENAEVYQWTLDAGARPLRPGEVTTFVTRVASPPGGAKNVEVRFAHADEIEVTPKNE